MNYDYIGRLSADEQKTAIRLDFSSYKPIVGQSAWDNYSYHEANHRHAILESVFIVSLKEGATYDFFSTSYFDPFLLLVYDFSGRIIAVDDNQGPLGMDVIFDFVPSYSGDHYVSASWFQGALPAQSYVSLSVYEDVDTIPKTGPVYGTFGIDTASLSGLRSGYTFKLDGESVTLVRAGEDDKQYVGVERFRFDDIAIATDINGNAGKAYRLYEAAFDRQPDASGLGYWINGLDYGVTLLSIANSFLGSNEFKARYGDQMSNADYVTALYLNVLNRAPDQAGTDFWVQALNNGSSRAQLLVNFSESIENQQGVIGAIQNGIQYEFWG